MGHAKDDPCQLSFPPPCLKMFLFNHDLHWLKSFIKSFPKNSFYFYLLVCVTERERDPTKMDTTEKGENRKHYFPSIYKYWGGVGVSHSPVKCSLFSYWHAIHSMPASRVIVERDNSKNGFQRFAFFKGFLSERWTATAVNIAQAEWCYHPNKLCTSTLASSPGKFLNFRNYG